MYSSSTVASRIDPPRSVVVPIKRNGHGLPDDVLLLTFDNIRMAADDVTMALMTASKRVCDLLSLASGKDQSPIHQEFWIRETWFRFELGWDAHSDRPLLLAELQMIIVKLYEIAHRYHMRQLTFKYLVQGHFHCAGRLRNPPSRPPPRSIAIGAEHLNVPYGNLVWSDFGRPMDFETVANAMLGIFLHAWDLMVETRKSSDRIRAQQTPYTYHDIGRSLRLQISPGAAQNLKLRDILDIAYFTVEFGRIFYMEEHHCSLVDTYYPERKQVLSSLSRGIS